MAKENIAFLVNLRKNTAVGTDREGRYTRCALPSPPTV